MAGKMSAKLVDVRDCGQLKPCVAATGFGLPALCMQAVQTSLAAAQHELQCFCTESSAGRTMEGFIRQRLAAGVLDLVTTELANDLLGGTLAAGPNRCTAAAIEGIPQLLSVGWLDAVRFGPEETIPEKYRSRRLNPLNSTTTLVRTTPEEMDELGKEIAQKASAARGPVAIALPLRGTSSWNAEGQPFWWPEADRTLFESIRNWLAPSVEVLELDLHIDDPVFASFCAAKLLELMAR